MMLLMKGKGDEAQQWHVKPRDLFCCGQTLHVTSLSLYPTNLPPKPITQRQLSPTGGRPTTITVIAKRPPQQVVLGGESAQNAVSGCAFYELLSLDFFFLTLTNAFRKTNCCHMTPINPSIHPTLA